MEDSNPYQELNIRHFKLTSGEEIIGLITSLDAKKQLIHVERPVVIHTSIGRTHERYYMNEWMPMSRNKTAQLAIMHVVAQTEVTDEMKEHYIKYCIRTNDSIQELTDPYDDDEDMVTPDRSKFH